MLFSLLYLVVRTIFRLTPARDGFDRDLEIMVLRHQVKVLRRKQGRPRLRRIDKLFLAGASRILARIVGHPSSSPQRRSFAGTEN